MSHDPLDPDRRRAGAVGPRRGPGPVRALVERYQARLVNYLYRMVRNLERRARSVAGGLRPRVSGSRPFRSASTGSRPGSSGSPRTRRSTSIRKRRFQLVPLTRREDEGSEATVGSSSSGRQAPSALETLEGRERDASSAGGDRRPALGVPRADPAPPLRRARLRGDRRGQGDAARDGEEQAVPRAPDAEAAAARPEGLGN